jgi:hypothetical protein
MKIMPKEDRKEFEIETFTKSEERKTAKTVFVNKINVSLEERNGQ